ncbi:MAG: hypothetical protein DI535_03045 [Citrobacter freundii]|nr:MAG: hypothetical protein DI535_03045 [Citrobacter freundii]
MLTSLKRFSLLCTLAVLLGVALHSCKKDEIKQLDPGQVAFFSSTQLTGSYSIVSPGVVYKIPVGLTSPVSSGKTKTVNVTATSTTGAVEGTHFTYTKTLTFAPDKITDTIIVTGVQAQYLAGRKDVVKFTFADASDFSPTLNSTFTLNISGPCFEGDINPDDFLGTYANTVETFGAGSPYGPYTTTISSVVSTGPKTAEITVTNLYDAGWNPIKFTMDWSDVTNRKITLTQQSGIADAGTVSATYEGEDISVRSSPAGPGTFSWCEGTLTLKLQVGVTGLGWFNQSPYYIVTLER